MCSFGGWVTQSCQDLDMLVPVRGAIRVASTFFINSETILMYKSPIYLGKCASISNAFLTMKPSVCKNIGDVLILGITCTLQLIRFTSNGSHNWDCCCCFKFREQHSFDIKFIFELGKFAFWFVVWAVVENWINYSGAHSALLPDKRHRMNWKSIRLEAI